MVQHTIPTLQDNPPINTRPYRVPETLKSEINSQVHKVLKDKVIIHSSSPYNSPLLLVPKKSDTDEKKLRLVIDYRKLPNITDIFDQLGNSRLKYLQILKNRQNPDHRFSSTK